ncbi:hypothetical protein BGZ60DRAFT_426558 [Tricladium varicosporioides]|nr:hypothetical protein BGZ60DRAFT_426558 [Hymenoscyphus varicosporioides]
MPIILSLGDPSTPWNVTILTLLWVLQLVTCLIMGGISLLGSALIYGGVNTFTLDVMVLLLDSNGEGVLVRRIVDVLVHLCISVWKYGELWEHFPMDVDPVGAFYRRMVLWKEG